MTPKRFMDETSRADAGLRLTPRRGKLLIRLKSAARSLAKTVSGLKHALRERGDTARRACAPRTRRAARRRRPESGRASCREEWVGTVSYRGSPDQVKKKKKK